MIKVTCEIGDRVRFRMDGPIMEVVEKLKCFRVDQEAKATDRFVRCKWSEDGEMKYFSFREDELIHVSGFSLQESTRRWFAFSPKWGITKS